nr:immunoglobulin heavy chain junction region [Macaca mulatta]MOW89489.1 immunoglobulin heavy chain junction region [Macaca mulatta]MOW89511.1 immunoglobulin heavy chain junction region [Macaca mulatta]MOW90787.1 immunoglobulin heavy chain junction region [Macaca mulatta]MOW91418.1 immunoglobulin heavy chain junction region [Macaca mulatta]
CARADYYGGGLNYW